MRVGLIDIDYKGFPNIALMKLSAWHKRQGDAVEWYAAFGERYDLVYVSKVFSFSPDYDLAINADRVEYGGTGYAISTVNGREIYSKEKDKDLPYEIEHTCPDCSLYADLTKDTAYGFLTRGCPRGCPFCIVGRKEGLCSKKVAELDEFWHGEKNIVLCDPNILAAAECESLLEQLAESKACVDFNQGLDIRLMTEKRALLLKQIKKREVRFAWDKYQDGDKVLPKLQLYAEITGQRKSNHNAMVYTLTNFDTTFEQDLERIYKLREIGFWPYVTIYNKPAADRRYLQLQRWVNNRFVFASCKRFEDYKYGC